MALFKRTPKEDPAARGREAIAGFWSWWATEGRVLASASTAGEVGPDELAAALSGAVDAIHPDLDWETAAGTDSRHLLTVTAAGVPELRAAGPALATGGPARGRGVGLRRPPAAGRGRRGRDHPEDRRPQLRHR